MVLEGRLWPSGGKASVNDWPLLSTLLPQLMAKPPVPRRPLLSALDLSVPFPLYLWCLLPPFPCSKSQFPVPSPQDPLPCSCLLHQATTQWLMSECRKHFSLCTISWTGSLYWHTQEGNTDGLCPELHLEGFLHSYEGKTYLFFKWKFLICPIFV